MRISIYVLICLSVSATSLYIDWGTDSFTWFQRSGTFVALAGAILSYRAMLKLGVGGVGGLQSSTFTIGTLKGSRISDDGRRMLSIERSQEDIEYELQVALDKLAGYLGAILAVMGMAICGYGDLLGKL